MKKIRSITITLMFLVGMSIFWAGCPWPWPWNWGCSTLPSIENTFYADSGNINNQSTNTVSVGFFNEAWMAPGDNLWLKFPCNCGTDWSIASSNTNHITTTTSGGSHQYLSLTKVGPKRVKISLDQNIPLATLPVFEQITIDFKDGSSTFFTFKINIRPKNKIRVMKGDANGNGHVDMLDMAAIAEAMVSGIPQGPETPHLNPAYTWVETWDQHWNWGGLVNEKIDFAHADMNGDGFIDIQDLDTLKKYIQPIDLDIFLRDGVNNATFLVKKDPNQEVICFPSIDGYFAHVEIPYIVTNGPNTINSVLGIVHRRPLTENSCAKIRGLKPEIETGFFSRPEGVLGHHELWREDNTYLENLCLVADDEAIAVVDIGMFFNSTPRKTLQPNQKLMNCIVDVDDILGQVRNGNCTINSYSFDGVVFGEGLDGGITISPASCSVSSYRLTAQDTCMRDTSFALVIRDQQDDCGREKGPSPAALWHSPDIIISIPNKGEVNSIDTAVTYNIKARAFNLMCNAISGGQIALYWTEKDVNDGFILNDLHLIDSKPIPQIQSREYVQVDFPSVKFTPSSQTSEISLIVVLDHPKDPQPSGISVGSHSIGHFVTTSNSIAALKLPIVP